MRNGSRFSNKISTKSTPSKQQPKRRDNKRSLTPVLPVNAEPSWQMVLTPALDRLQRGDIVSTGPNTPPAEIRCVVRTQIANQTPSLVHLPGGLMVTATHPVRTSPQSGRWVFPRDLSPARPTPGVPHIFSFLLEGRGQEGNGAGMVIEGVECIALAHGVEGR